MGSSQNFVSDTITRKGQERAFSVHRYSMSFSESESGSQRGKPRRFQKTVSSRSHHSTEKFGRVHRSNQPMTSHCSNLWLRR